MATKRKKSVSKVFQPPNTVYGLICGGDAFIAWYSESLNEVLDSATHGDRVAIYECTGVPTVSKVVNVELI